MTIRFLNGFSCHARVPSSWHTGGLCLLVETAQGLTLVDTGLGREDYLRRPAILRTFQVVTRCPLDPEEAVVRQLARLGCAPEDVRHIVLTHMHFDHCGGLPDFPQAVVHVHRREAEAFAGRARRWTELAYVRRHLAHAPRLETYEESGETWLGWPAARLPFEPQLWLVPLLGHTRGHCGVAIQTEAGWHFHVGDAGPIALGDEAPAWLVRAVLGPHAPSLRAFAAAHPEVRMTTGHMWLDFYAAAATGA